MPRPLSVLIVPVAPLEPIRAFLRAVSLQYNPSESSHSIDVVHHWQRLSVYKVCKEHDILLHRQFEIDFPVEHVDEEVHYLPSLVTAYVGYGEAAKVVFWVRCHNPNNSFRVSDISSTLTVKSKFKLPLSSMIIESALLIVLSAASSLKSSTT